MNPRNYILQIAISTILLFITVNCPGEKADSSKQNMSLAAIALAASGGATISTLNVSGFNKPEAIGVNLTDNTLIVADTKNNQIKKIVSETTVTILMDTNAIAVALVSPEGLCVDSSGNIFINNTDANNIVKIPTGGTPVNYADSANSPVITATFNGSEGIFCGANNILYIADVGNNQIRKIQTNTVSLVAGDAGGAGGFVNANGTSAKFNGPKGVAADSSGNIYVADNLNHAIRKITAAGDVTTLAGSSAGISGSTNGTGISARFNKPYALTIDDSGNIYTTDSTNNLIRKITPAGVVTTVVGNGSAGSVDGVGTNASLNDPRGIAFDSNQKVIYVTTAGDSKIRKIINF